jgi:NAD(P)-dependent dehydrogenase (short-subunit alcohol dehydrogenase family)
MDVMLQTRPVAAATQRVALVTGGTGGIGAAVAEKLATDGDRVIIVGRDLERGAATVRLMAKLNPKADHRFLAADLALLSEAARVGDEIAALAPRLDAAVFCAGILSAIPEWTSEGLERTLALNYLSRFLMIRQLLPQLERSASGRVVLVANAGIYPDTLDFDDLQHRRGRRGLKVAGRTQFANDLLAVELASRLAGTNIAVSCIFPGFVRTGVFDNARGLPAAFRFIRPLLEARSISPAAAAETPVFFARALDAGAATNGRFFGPQLKPRRIPSRVMRRDRRAGLWKLSEELVRHYLR